MYLFQIGHCAAAVSTGAQRRIHILLDQGQVIACSQLVLQEERRANAAELAMRNDGNPVAQNVCLIHVVCRENDSAACKKAKEDTGIKQPYPSLQNKKGHDHLGFNMKLHRRFVTQVEARLYKDSSMEKVHNCCHSYILSILYTPLPCLAEVG